MPVCMGVKFSVRVAAMFSVRVAVMFAVRVAAVFCPDASARDVVVASRRCGAAVLNWLECCEARGLFY